MGSSASGADVVVRDGKGLAQAGGADVVLGTGNSVDAMADAPASGRTAASC